MRSHLQPTSSGEPGSAPAAEGIAPPPFTPPSVVPQPVPLPPAQRQAPPSAPPLYGTPPPAGPGAAAPPAPFTPPFTPPSDPVGAPVGPDAPDAVAPPAPGSPAPAAAQGNRVDWATVPRVNLLPREIVDTRRFRVVKRVLIGAVLFVGVLCGLLTFWEQSKVTEARDELELTQKQGAALKLEQSSYAKVPKVQSELDAALAARERALGTDVLWFTFLTDLAVNTPPGTVLQSVTISMDGTTAVSATGADPVTPPGLGTVKVSGEASRFTDVASWLTATGEVSGLSGSQLQSAARTEGQMSAGAGDRITYSGTAVITPGALSHRYDRKGG